MLEFDDEQSWWARAVTFAATAHQGQVRRDGGTPYIAHPLRVAMTVAVTFGVRDDETLAAAVLHDVIEDCAVDYDEIAAAFTQRIADIVAALSKDARLPESKREVAYDRQLADGPIEARLIKLADVADNLADSDSESRRRRMISKAERAIALADQDESLRGAVEHVQRILAMVGGGGLA